MSTESDLKLFDSAVYSIRRGGSFIDILPSYLRIQDESVQREIRSLFTKEALYEDAKKVLKVASDIVVSLNRGDDLTYPTEVTDFKTLISEAIQTQRSEAERLGRAKALSIIKSLGPNPQRKAEKKSATPR